MSLPQPVRQQRIDMAATQSLRAIAQDGLRRGIRQQDDAVGVNDQHAIGTGFQQLQEYVAVTDHGGAWLGHAVLAHEWLGSVFNLTT